MFLVCLRQCALKSSLSYALDLEKWSNFSNSTPNEWPRKSLSPSSKFSSPEISTTLRIPGNMCLQEWDTPESVSEHYHTHQKHCFGTKRHIKNTQNPLLAFMEIRGVFVCWGCSNTRDWLAWTAGFISHRSGGWASESKVPAWSSSSSWLTDGLLLAVPSRGRGEGPALLEGH